MNSVKAVSGPDSITATTETSFLRRWTVLTLLAVAALIAFLDRTSISAAMTVDTFKRHFLLSDVDRGWINSAFFWSYALFQVPLGWVVDRYGVKKPYTICFLVWCLASAATGLMHSVAGLVAMRLLVGAAESVVVPASYRWIRANFHPDDSGTPVGFYMLGTKFGPAIGAPLAAWLIVAFDWKIMFLISGVAGLLWLVPWMLLARNDRPAPPVTQAGVRTTDNSYSAILASPLIWGTFIIMFCYNYFTFFCMTWMPAYLVEQRGLSLEKMGLYTFFSFAGMAIVALVSGWAADRMIRRYGHPVLIRKAFVIAGFAIACTVILGALTDNVETALFWNVISLSGLGLASANSLALCSLTLIPAAIVGRVKGIQNLAPSLAGILSPLITGWLLHKTGSFLAPMTLIFVFLLIGAFSVVALLRPEWAPKVPDTID